MADGYRFHPMDDVDADPDDLAELLNQEHRKDVYFSTVDEKGDLLGFFRFAEKDGSVDVGLGMRPDLTGKGLGSGFLASGLDFARRRFAPARFTLSVAAFNERAIRAYERAGFGRGEVFRRETNGGEHEFLSMWREA